MSINNKSFDLKTQVARKLFPIFFIVVVSVSASLLVILLNSSWDHAQDQRRLSTIEEYLPKFINLEIGSDFESYDILITEFKNDYRWRGMFTFLIPPKYITQITEVKKFKQDPAEMLTCIPNVVTKVDVAYPLK